MKQKRTPCPNALMCGCEGFDNQTPDFTGYISIMTPSVSWVAQWNGLANRKPGVYAMLIMKDNDDAAEYQQDKRLPPGKDGKKRKSKK